MQEVVRCVPVAKGFEVYVYLSRELIDNAEHLKSLVNRALSGTGIHVCMTRHEHVIHFTSSTFSSWQESRAKHVCDTTKLCMPVYQNDTAKLKRKRQVRDAVNKCNDPQIIEEIARLLRL